MIRWSSRIVLKTARIGVGTFFVPVCVSFRFVLSVWRVVAAVILVLAFSRSHHRVHNDRRLTIDDFLIISVLFLLLLFSFVVFLVAVAQIPVCAPGQL